MVSGAEPNLLKPGLNIFLVGSLNDIRTLVN